MYGALLELQVQTLAGPLVTYGFLRGRGNMRAVQPMQWLGFSEPDCQGQAFVDERASYGVQFDAARRAFVRDPSGECGVRVASYQHDVGIADWDDPPSCNDGRPQNATYCEADSVAGPVAHLTPPLRILPPGALL